MGQLRVINYDLILVINDLIRLINYNLINLIVKGEEDLAKDVMVMLDTLTVEMEGFWMVPELYKVPEDKVNHAQGSRTVQGSRG